MTAKLEDCDLWLLLCCCQEGSFCILHCRCRAACVSGEKCAFVLDAP